MGGDVRTTVGVPKLSAFANGSGTPIVIDTLTGQGYYTEKNAVVPISASGGDAAPSFLVGGSAAQVFPSNAQTQLTNYTYAYPAVVPGWNAVTGEYTVQKAGWYAISFWVSSGQTSAKMISPIIQAVSLNAVVYQIATQDVISIANPRTYMTGCAGSVVANLSVGQKVKAVLFVIWADDQPHAVNDGALNLSLAYLHP